MTTNSVIALIPAAGGSKDSLGRISNFPASLALVSGSPLINLILEGLIATGLTEFRIGVAEHYLEDFRYATRRFNSSAQLRFFPVEGKGTPVETIRILSEGLPADCSVLLNLGDTYCQWNFHEFESSPVAMLLDSVADTERWATATTDKTGRIIEIFEKGDAPVGALGVCGVYWWRDSKLLLGALERVPTDGEISSVLKETDSEIFGKVPKMWIDSDHQDILENSRLSMVQARSFNSITVDPFYGSLEKKSTNASKLLREISYYQNLPNKLKIFFPRMVNFELSETEPIQELEYYSYPNLSEIFVYESAPKFVWEKVLHKLGRIVFESFASFRTDEISPSLSEVFVEKCASRIPELLATDTFPSSLLSASGLSINGNHYQGIDSLLEGSKVVLNSIQSPSTIIHGDFCLSNIICDVNSINIKLIDPRGGFKTPSCFGPQIYDVAKLGHSILGKYDLIIADQFRVDVQDQALNVYLLEIYSRESHLIIEEAFYSHFVRGRFESRLLKLISGLSLLSIPIFHLDKPDRAIALFLQGVRMTHNALEEFE